MMNQYWMAKKGYLALKRIKTTALCAHILDGIHAAAATFPGFPLAELFFITCDF